MDAAWIATRFPKCHGLYCLHRQEIRKLVRFVVVGVTSLALYSGLYALLSRVIWVAGNRTFENFLATALSAVFNFIANRSWTFCSARELEGTHLRHLRRYIAVLVAAALLQSFLFYLGHEVLRLYDFLVIYPVAFFMAFLTYLSHRFYTFHAPKTEGSPAKRGFFVTAGRWTKVTVIRLKPFDFIWIAYGIAVVVISGLHGPLNSDDALYWINRRTYGMLLRIPFLAVFHGIGPAIHQALSSLEGAGTIAMIGKPLYLFLTLPFLAVSSQWFSMAFPTAIVLAAVFAFGLHAVKTKRLRLLYAIIFASSPMLLLLGYSANLMAGCFLALATVVFTTPTIAQQRRWFWFGMLLSIGAVSHYASIPVSLILIAVALIIERKRVARRDLLLFAIGLSSPVLVVFFLTVIMENLFALGAGQNIFLNYFDQLFQQFAMSSSTAQPDYGYYARILFSIEGVWALVPLAVCFPFRSVRRLYGSARFLMAAVATVAGLVIFSSKAIQAGRTLGMVLPLAYLALSSMMTVGEDRVGQAVVRRSFRRSWRVWAATGSAALLLWARAPVLANIVSYRDLGNRLQQVITRQDPTFGNNPYIEGHSFHLFRYAFLSKATPEELTSHWRQNARIWAYEWISDDASSNAFVAACARRKGTLYRSDWNIFSLYNWAVDAEGVFGTAKSVPFAYCIAPEPAK